MIQTDYIVSEDETDVTVCAVVETSSGPAYCPVGFEFNISLSTVGQTAGTITTSDVDIPCTYMHFFHT